MFRSKIRIHTCQVILLTSLVWFLVDVAVIMFYSDCIGGSSGGGWGCSSNTKNKLQQTLDSNHINDINNLIEPEDTLDIEDRRPKAFQQTGGDPGRTYSPTELHLWRPAKFVREIPGAPGELGRAVQIPADQEAKQQELFKLNQFNLMASDMISFNRSLKDVRLEGCKKKKYPKLLPDTSIVIVFHNEAWSTLLRTVWSVINRSPRSLLKEIILVDDASERGTCNTF